jgi:hypothetical protein
MGRVAASTNVSPIVSTSIDAMIRRFALLPFMFGSFTAAD